MLTGEAAERYRAWRASVPWSDEEILAVLDDLGKKGWKDSYLYREMAVRVRAGFLGRLIVNAVVPFLVRTCGVCGETALYRYGYIGRCGEHRSVAPPWAVERKQQMQRAHAEMERSFRDWHRQEQSVQRLKAAKRR